MQIEQLQHEYERVQVDLAARNESHSDYDEVVPHASWLWKGKIPSLDGLRAIAIILVLVSHIGSTKNSPVASSFFWFLTGWGGTGVDLFFVISGFLITLLLIRERAKTGTVSLKGFYIRRALRILPAYGIFLVGLALLSSLDRVRLDAGDWLRALTYTVNFQNKYNWNVAHIWSLCVEEHFYLTWPFIFVLVGATRSWLIALTSVVLAPFFRLIIRIYFHNYLDEDFFTLSRMDAIAVGCLLAFATTTPYICNKMQIPGFTANIGIIFIIVVLVVNTQIHHLSSTLALLLCPTVNAVAFAGLIWIAASHSTGVVGKVLNSRPFVAVGLLSYSLYLWQQPFLNPRNQVDPMCAFPLNLLLAVLIAAISYLAIESPILRLKDRRSFAKPVALPNSAASPFGVSLRNLSQ
jgi:peptidoglycan/LPS O-acetylase OafA/YrhL